MKVKTIHSLNIHDEDVFKNIQNDLRSKISHENRIKLKDVELCAGVDLAYWEKDNVQYGVCCIVVYNIRTDEIVEMKYQHGVIEVPYVAGYLAFRELPLIVKTVKLLKVTPSVFLFDGNGYLHSKNMGIATHASFFLEAPTIGVAKSYLKVGNVECEYPEGEKGSFTDIVVNNEVYGRCLRSRNEVKPIFVSCGNHIDLDTATELVLKLVDSKSSRIPIPIRLADIETRKLREKLNV